MKKQPVEQVAQQTYVVRRSSINNGQPYRQKEQFYDQETEEYDDVLPSLMPRSAIRYNVNNDVLARGVHVQHHYYDQPLAQTYQQPIAVSKSRQNQQIPPARQQTKDDEREPVRHTRKRHSLVFFGLALLLMVIGGYAFNAFTAWWQAKQDDMTYGNPRTYQTNAVIGHSDSNSNPTHFIALNLNGNILVIELPGGNATKARSYPITSIIGNSGNPPVKLLFQDINRDGKLDMIVQIGDPGQVITVLLVNNGTQFVNKL